MAHGRGIYMSDSPGLCYQYGKIIILSRVLCNISAGDTLTMPGKNGTDTIYVIKNVANILPYCVINKNQAMGNGTNTTNQQPNFTIIPAKPTFPSYNAFVTGGGLRRGLGGILTSQMSNAFCYLTHNRSKTHSTSSTPSLSSSS